MSQIRASDCQRGGLASAGRIILLLAAEASVFRSTHFLALFLDSLIWLDVLWVWEEEPVDDR